MHGSEISALGKENIAQRLSVFVQSVSPDWTKENNFSVNPRPLSLAAQARRAVL
jgi:hypothetical protein